MPAPDSMTCDRLAKLIGTPRAPIVLDVRRAALRNADPRLIASARALDEADLAPDALASLAQGLTAQSVVVACAAGHARSQGVAAWLRQQGVQAEYLEGGHEAWIASGHVMHDPTGITARDGLGRSLWVTRSRPKIDRIACPWLIRRFIDPREVFLFVAPSEVLAVAELFGAAPFDIEGTFWSHRDEGCTFDTILAEFGRSSPALMRLATIVRGADTARPDLAPECAGLLAASLGLSRMYSDDLAQLDAGMSLYDAFYRWARDATDETHNWPINSGKKK